jgi:hypothetical protein
LKFINSKYLFACIISTVIFPALLFSQDSLSSFSGSKIILAGDYQASSFLRFFMGDHWRNLWITPIKVPVLNLNSFAGGLTPIKKGGGQQTRSLTLRGENGKEYKFRSINKDVSKGLPSDFMGSVVDEFMQDQISVINPASSVVVSLLMDTLGILNSKPSICVMPDDEKLGEFRNEFANLPGTIEEDPEDYYDKSLNFASADKIVNTFKLFEELQEDNDEFVNAVEFLKARLFDVFIGDRDRHAGQWKWAGYEKGKKRIWQPVPKDRDFTFPLYDGLIPRAMTVAFTSMVHFDYDMPSMLDMTWEGRHLDRRLLGSLDKTVWDSLALFLQNNITDKIISSAVRQLPTEYYNQEGEQLISKLISRRDQLFTAANEYYLWAAKYVDIYCSDKNEVAEVVRENNLFTTVSIFKRDKITGKKKGDAIYHRIFNNTVTDDIRLHLLGGDDIVNVSGDVDESIRIIVVGGEGNDELIDHSKVNGYLTFFLPIPDAKKKTEFYDSGKKTIFHIGTSTYVNTDEYVTPEDPELHYEPDIEDRFHDYFVLLPWGYDTDDGIIVGAGLRINYYDFRMNPYDHRLDFSGSYSNITERAELEFLGDYYDLIGGMNVKIPVRYTGLETTRFYGFGNETVRNDSLVEESYYNVNQKYFGAGFLLDLPLTDHLSLQTGLLFEYSYISRKEERFLSSINPYGVGGLDNFAISTSIQYDNRDNIELPFKGYYFNLYGDVYPNTLNNKEFFGKAAFDGRTYLSSNFLTDYTLALRLYGEAAWGDYPFYKAATVGGKKTLRGFPRDRFVGDFSILTDVELRFYLAKIYFLIPFKLGMNLFTDTGRVFLRGESSDKWHNSFGGGFWFSILERSINFSINFAKSPETFRVYLSFGQMF